MVGRSTRSLWARAVRAAAALVCWCAAAAATAQTGGTNHVFSDVPNGYDFDLTRTNAPAKVSRLSPCTACPNSIDAGAVAEADAATLTWRAAAGWSGSVEGVQSRVSAESTWATVLQAGTSGLSAGDPVTLTVQLRWDGTMGASFRAVGGPSGYDMRSGVAGFVGMSITDTDTSSQWQIAGRMDSELSTALCSEPSACGGNTYAYTRRTDQIDLTEFIGGVQSWAWSGGSFSDTIDPVANSGAKSSLSVDTGILSFSFLTAIGDHLVITGMNEVMMGCDGSGGQCATWSDFSHTFQAALVPDVQGVVIDGLAPVPEPGTPTLLAAGLAVLWRLRRHALDRGAAGA